MDATLHGHSDTMESPSARIVLGRVVELGTGAISLLQNLPKFDNDEAVVKNTVAVSG